jgi:tetratricopeptide (TPR) repeat protein
MDWRCSCRGIKFWHERKPGPASEYRSLEKSHAELEVLRASWNERGDRRALFYLANGLRESGKHEEAVAAYHEYLTSPNFEEEGWQALLYLGRSYAALRDFTSARHMFEQALLKFPERAESAVALGHVLLELRQPRAAAAWFRHAASLPVPDHFRLFVEVPAYKWQAWHGLALAQYSQNEFAAAAEAEHQALRHGAGEWARQNLDDWNARAAAVAA